MIYNRITPLIIEKLKQIVGESYVFFDSESLHAYGHDQTDKMLFLPELVIKPCTPEEIRDI